jgi:type I restriction enzyme, S subunit
MKFEKLGNIADIIAGQSPPSSTYNSERKGIPFFQGKADYGEKYPSVRYWCTEPTKISLPGDILISMRAPVGPVNINIAKSCIGRGLSAIRVKKNANRDYIYFWLKLNQYLISAKETGSTFKAITQKVLNEIVVPFPSYKDQLHIAKLLSKAESLISQRKESIRLLDEFLKSTFLEMFGDPIIMIEKKAAKLIDYIDFLTSGSRGWAKYYSNKGAKFLRIQNVWKGSLRTEEMQFVNAPDTQESIRTKVQEGDLLITITADLGRTAVVPKNFGEAHINQHIALVRLNKQINPTYAAFFYFMPFGNSAIQKKDKSAVKSGLTFNDIRNLPIIVPPVELQNQFAQIVEKTESLKTQYKKSLQELENLYGSLSQKAFRGELGLKDTALLSSAEHGRSVAAEPKVKYD